MLDLTRDENNVTRSWPIAVAVLPMLMDCFTGNADLWNDFFMLLFILYYVYQWLTGK
jgi:hypothetical protein